MYAVDHVKLVYHIKDKLSHSPRTEVLLSILPFYLPVLGLTNARLTFSGNWQSRTYSTLIHIYRLQQTVGNITNEILAGKDLRIAVFWNFVVIFAFYNRHFIVVLDSAIRMSAFDSLV